MELPPPAQRVLGSLVEKALATPQQYPLTLNSLRTACNQSTGREPVVDYDDNTVEAALADLRPANLVRTEVSRGSRTPKYAHRLEEELELDQRDQAVMALLLLRGPQTEGELRNRSDRLYAFSSLEEVDQTLASLADRRHVEHLERRRGEKAARWRHRWGPDPSGAAGSSAATDAASSVSTPTSAGPAPDRVDGSSGRVEDGHTPPGGEPVAAEHQAPSTAGSRPAAADIADLRERVASLEREVAELRREVDSAVDDRPTPGLL